MKLEITSNKAVQTKRGPMVVQQMLIRTANGVVLHEQWTEPQQAQPVGHYEADVEIYQSDRRAAVGFGNLRPIKASAAA
jgi:hypothetical protein